MSEQSKVSSESVLCVISCEKFHQHDSEYTFSFLPFPIPSFSPHNNLLAIPWVSFPSHDCLAPTSSHQILIRLPGVWALGWQSWAQRRKNFGGGQWEPIELSRSIKESLPGARWEDTSVTGWHCRCCKSTVISGDSVSHGWGLHQFHLQSQALWKQGNEMVNHTSWGIVGSCNRKLEHIKWKLAFNGMAL